MINVLFVPNPMPSHVIPLLMLDRQLDKRYFKTAFLLPKTLHLFVKKVGSQVLDIDKEMQFKTNSEMIAFSKFKPDVLIDDLNFTSAFSTRFAKIPRITIVRKGILPHEEYKAGSVHSSPVIDYLDKLKKIDLPSYGIWKPNKTSDLFVGNVNIIPSIPTVEKLPLELKSDPSYLFSGPLLLSDDDLMKNSGYLPFFKDQKFKDCREDIDKFFELHKDLKKIYFTHGITKPDHIVGKTNACISYLLQSGFAVITSVAHDRSVFTEEEKSRLFSYPVLPMHQVCSNVDLMIHHCGSGTYNYQILYEVPSIVLASNCYDRDEVGMQLQNLGAAIFIDTGENDQQFQSAFENAVSELLSGNSEKYEQQKAILADLHKQAISTQKEFNLAEIIQKVIIKK